MGNKAVHLKVAIFHEDCCIASHSNASWIVSCQWALYMVKRGIIRVTWGIWPSISEELIQGQNLGVAIILSWRTFGHVHWVLLRSICVQFGLHVKCFAWHGSGVMGLEHPSTLFFIKQIFNALDCFIKLRTYVKIKKFPRLERCRGLHICPFWLAGND